MKILTESNNAYQRRIDELYAKNVIIPKEGEAEPINQVNQSKPEAEFTRAM